MISEPFPVVVSTDVESERGLGIYRLGGEVPLERFENSVEGGVDLTIRHTVFFTERDKVDLLKSLLDEKLGKDFAVYPIESLEFMSSFSSKYLPEEFNMPNAFRSELTNDPSLREEVMREYIDYLEGKPVSEAAAVSGG